MYVYICIYIYVCVCIQDGTRYALFFGRKEKKAMACLSAEPGPRQSTVVRRGFTPVGAEEGSSSMSVATKGREAERDIFSRYIITSYIHTYLRIHSMRQLGRNYSTYSLSLKSILTKATKVLDVDVRLILSLVQDCVCHISSANQSILCRFAGQQCSVHRWELYLSTTTC